MSSKNSKKLQNECFLFVGSLVKHQKNLSPVTCILFFFIRSTLETTILQTFWMLKSVDLRLKKIHEFYRMFDAKKSQPLIVKDSTILQKCLKLKKGLWPLIEKDSLVHNPRIMFHPKLLKVSFCLPSHQPNRKSSEQQQTNAVYAWRNPPTQQKQSSVTKNVV